MDWPGQDNRSNPSEWVVQVIVQVCELLDGLACLEGWTEGGMEPPRSIQQRLRPGKDLDRWWPLTTVEERPRLSSERIGKVGVACKAGAARRH